MWCDVMWCDAPPSTFPFCLSYLYFSKFVILPSLPSFSYISFSHVLCRSFSGNLNLIHLAERASYRLLDLYRDGGKVEKMAAEYKRAAFAFRDISDLASSQFALGTFYSVLYLGLGESAT